MPRKRRCCSWPRRSARCPWCTVGRWWASSPRPISSAPSWRRPRQKPSDRRRRAAGMVIVAVNAGSSSLKAQLIDATPAGERRLAHALVERIGGSAAITVDVADQPSRRDTRDVPDHDAALVAILTAFRDIGLPRPEAAGHRIVHGGSRFTAPVKIDDGVVAALTALQELAPLHNAP